MRIAYDHQAFCRRPYTGISRYYTQLLHHLPLHAGDHARLFAPIHVNALLTALPPRNRHTSVFGYGLKRHPRLLRPFIRQVSGQFARRSIAQWRPDVVHETYYANQSSAPRGVPTVLTVFDLIHEQFPQLFPWYDRVLIAKRTAIARATRIICISETTRRDLLTHYPTCQPQCVAVVPLGVETTPIAPLSFSALPAPLAAQLTHPFLLFVGERGGYKNFTTVIHALAQSHWLRREFQLLCCGGGQFTRTERQQLQSLGIAAQVHQYSGDDALLHTLYHHAAALVYPSYYEGFGLPLLEAMQHNCPVIASDAGALPEIAGNAAWLFPPHESEALRVALETVLQSNTIRAQLQQAGQVRVAAFHWSRCAAATLAHYHALQR